MTELNDSTQRPHDGEIHVHVTHWTQDGDQTKEMLFRLELWPIPAELGTKIINELAALAMQRLDEAGEVHGDWQNHHEGEIFPDTEESSDVVIVQVPRTLQ